MNSTLGTEQIEVVGEPLVVSTPEEVENESLSAAPPLAVAPFDAAAAQGHQEAWAKHLGVQVEIENSIGIKLAFIPAGEFLMGAPDSDAYASDSEKPQHTVRITKPFYLGVTEVTQEQYERVMGTNPSHFKRDPTRPVEMVTWNDAVSFCEKLAELSEEQAVRAAYRLPTEAEWEYACRAGTTTRWYATDDQTALQEQAWFAASSGGTTHPVRQKSPNAWGLYDMHGNLYEWCSDWYAEGYYAESLVDDPAGPTAGSSRVIRGGCWGNPAGDCRSAYRCGYRPSYRNGVLGFRVAFSSVDQSDQ